MRYVVFISVLTLMAPALPAEYFIAPVGDYRNKYTWAFEGTYAELEAQVPPLPGDYTEASGMPNNVYPDGFHSWSNSGSSRIARVRGYRVSDDSYKTNYQYLLVSPVTEQEFLDYINQNVLIDDGTGAWFEFQHLPNPDGDLNDDGLTDEVAERLGLDPAGDPVAMESGDFSDLLIYNDSNLNKDFVLYLADSNGDPAFILDQGAIPSQQTQQLLDYGGIPEGLDVYVQFYVNGQTSGAPNQVSPNDASTPQNFFAETYTEGAGVAYPVYVAPPAATTAQPSTPVNDYESDFQTWLEQAQSAGNINFEGDLARGVRAGVEMAADSITDPIQAALDDHAQQLADNATENADNIVDAINSQTNNGQTLTFDYGDTTGTASGATIDQLANEVDTELDDIFEAERVALDNSLNQYKSGVVETFDGLLAKGGDVTQSTRDIMDSVSDAISALSVGAGTSWEVVPAGFFGGFGGAVTLDFGAQPWSTIKNIVSTVFGFLWILMCVKVCVDFFRWMASA